MNDEELRQLVRELYELMEAHGTRSEEVRSHVRKNIEVDGFKNIAMAAILVAEGKVTSTAVRAG